MIVNGGSGWKEPSRWKFSAMKANASLPQDKSTMILGPLKIIHIIRCSITLIWLVSIMRTTIMKLVMPFSDKRVILGHLKMERLGSGQSVNNMTHHSSGTAMLENGVLIQVIFHMTCLSGQIGKTMMIANANGGSTWKEWKTKNKFTDTKTSVSLPQENGLKVLGSLIIMPIIRLIMTLI